MNQKIIDYLQENKEKYTKESLVAQLKDAGYSDIDITEAVNNVYDKKEIPLPADKSKITAVSNEQDDGIYADFAIRVVANLFDGFIIAFSVGMVIDKIVLAFGGEISIVGKVLLFVFSFLSVSVYRIFMIYNFQATIGKMLFGIKVCDEDNFQKMSFKNIVVREIVGALIQQTVFFLLLHIMVNFTDKKQSIHDKLGHAVVVHKDKCNN